jgi:outer membrane lipoprotein-sorting protein
LRLFLERAKQVGLRARSGLYTFAALVTLLSCASIEKQTSPVYQDLPPRQWEPEELVRVLVQRVQQFNSLSAFASVSYRGTDGRGTFDEVVVVQRPHRLRLETLSALGALVVVTADGDEITGLHPREGLFVRGKSTKSNLLRYTQIPLELREITALLMGLPPVDVVAGWQVTGNSMMRRSIMGPTETISFDPALGVPIKWERTGSSGELEIRVLFSDFSPSPVGPFPLRISLEASPQEKRLDIRYRDPKLNVELSPSLFVQEKPQNAREIPLESLGG